MRIVVRSVQPGAADLKIGVDQVIDSARLSIGRGTDQQVQLNDLRVALAHAVITPTPRGGYQIEVAAGNSIWINGAPSAGRVIGPGDELEIGRYRLSILQPAASGSDLLIAVTEKFSARDEKSRRRSQYKLSLAASGWSKRRWAWLSASLILLVGLLLPAVYRYGLHAERVPDKIWSTGTMSRAHAQFGDDCGTCHGKAFERVSNTACAHCHTNTHEHSNRPELLQAGLAITRCESCHREHNGEDGLILRHAGLCTDCHANPDERYAAAHLPVAANFSEAHPDFRPLLARYANGQFSFERVLLQTGGVLREDTNLKFPHDIHLAPKGIDAPKGRRVLACADCHQPDNAGVSFQPLHMQTHCLECHRLDFDPAQPGRELPHGKPAEVVQIIRDYYAARSFLGDAPQFKPDPGEILQRRPGAPAPAPPATPAAANAAAVQAINDVFDRRVCSYCHVVEKTGDAQLPWRIAPVALNEHALSRARFDHAAHKTETCESCHDARKSKVSGDLLLPAMDNCRACHGDAGHAGSVPSTCITCHGFHTAVAP